MSDWPNITQQSSDQSRIRTPGPGSAHDGYATHINK